MFTTRCHTAPPILNFYPHDFGVSQSKTRTLPLRHMGGGAPSLIRYSSKTAEQNVMKLSGIVHYLMPYCTSYFKFLSAWLWNLGLPRAKQGLCHTKHGGAGGIILWALLTVFLVYLRNTSCEKCNYEIKSLFLQNHLSNVLRHIQWYSINLHWEFAIACDGICSIWEFGNWATWIFLNLNWFNLINI